MGIWVWSEDPEKPASLETTTDEEAAVQYYAETHGCEPGEELYSADARNVTGHNVTGVSDKESYA